MTPKQAETPIDFPYQIIGISGKQYTGKDLLADMLVATLPNFYKLPLAKAIKEAYAQKEGITLADIEANKALHRPGLIAMGDWGRAQDPDYWLKTVLAAPGNKIISDVRLKREYDLLTASGAFLIRLNADRAVRATRGTIVSESDPTECQLDDIPAQDWSLILTNNSTPEALLQHLDTALEHTFGIQ